MVAGIDKFQEYFSEYDDKYVVIGGAACFLLFDAAGLDFRVTKDIDMVICVEVLDVAFAQAIRKFLDDGNYQARERSGGKREFYRFHRPADTNFPYMIELFSRKPDTLSLHENARLTPIPVEDANVSLSAILLNDVYYEALHTAKRKVNGVTIIDEMLLIPFKAFAFLNLMRDEIQGKKTNRNNTRKHLNDVFRLAQLLPRDASFVLPDAIRKDLRSFLSLVESMENLNLQNLQINISRDEAIALMRSAYNLG